MRDWKIGGWLLLALLIWLAWPRLVRQEIVTSDITYDI